MVKYSPKENSYQEMYLINKFEKDVMENSLQNMGNDKTKTSQSSTTTNNLYKTNEKEEIENLNKTEAESEKGKQTQVSEKNIIPDFPEAFNSSVEKEYLNDISLSDNGNTPEQGVDTKGMSQSKKRKRVRSKKSSTPIIKNTSRKFSKGWKKDQLQKQKRMLMNEIFQNWKI